MACRTHAVRVRRVAVLTLLLQPPARRVTRLLRKVLATEKDVKAVRVAGWGLAQHCRICVVAARGDRYLAPDETAVVERHVLRPACRTQAPPGSLQPLRLRRRLVGLPAGNGNSA